MESMFFRQCFLSMVSLNSDLINGGAPELQMILSHQNPGAVGLCCQLNNKDLYLKRKLSTSLQRRNRAQGAELKELFESASPQRTNLSSSPSNMIRYFQSEKYQGNCNQIPHLSEEKFQQNDKLPTLNNVITQRNCW